MPNLLQWTAGPRCRRVFRLRCQVRHICTKSHLFAFADRPMALPHRAHGPCQRQRQQATQPRRKQPLKCSKWTVRSFRLSRIASKHHTPIGRDPGTNSLPAAALQRPQPLQQSSRGLSTPAQAAAASAAATHHDQAGPHDPPHAFRSSLLAAHPRCSPPFNAAHLCGPSVPQTAFSAAAIATCSPPRQLLQLSKPHTHLCPQMPSILAVYAYPLCPRWRYASRPTPAKLRAYKDRLSPRSNNHSSPLSQGPLLYMVVHAHG